MPVDTIGCVEFSHINWADTNTNTLYSNPYSACATLETKCAGANNILLTAAKQILHCQEKHQKDVSTRRP
ncbi:hypothetical protein [Komagataeibacter europaeus]|uniref:hypothetical protein n=1 Tax=Komagataeibacter europaeus TaxID=33995 RepID=UPI0015F8DD3B|nr:hypothetical protein [Komagataeibacter europaeus]